MEDIDSLEAQKAFYQVALEFFYLQDSDELSEDQDEFLESFSLSGKQANLVELRVQQLYSAMGPRGLAEKYGYVAVEEPEVPIDKENKSAQVKLTEELADKIATRKAINFTEYYLEQSKKI